VSLAVALTASVAGAGVGAQGEAARSREAALNAFRQRVEDYVELRNKVRGDMGKLEETTDPAEITRRERALGAAIREARAGARAGDLFTPDVAQLIRATVRANLERRPKPEKAAALSEVPGRRAVKVNDPYPDDIPLATVPPTLLGQLPPLPETLEYRFVGDRVVLRDIEANLVIDFVPKAVPRS
jgi:hypothetical protein